MNEIISGLGHRIQRGFSGQETVKLGVEIKLRPNEAVSWGANPMAAKYATEQMNNSRKVQIAGLKEGDISSSVLKVGLDSFGKWEFQALTDRNIVTLYYVDHKTGKFERKKFPTVVGGSFAEQEIKNMKASDQSFFIIHVLGKNQECHFIGIDPKSQSSSDLAKFFIVKEGPPRVAGLEKFFPAR